MEKDDYKGEIGRRIAEVRTRKGWTLAQLAKASSVGSSTLSNYEQGIRMPGPFEVKQIATATGESAAYLMCLDDQPLGKPGAAEHWLDPRADDLPQVFKEALKLKAKRYIEMVAKLPVAVVMMFKAPTSEDFESWERNVEASYKSIAGPSNGDKYSEHWIPVSGDIDQDMAREVLQNFADASLDGRKVILRTAQAASKAAASASNVKTSH